MNRIITYGIVLRRVEYGEADRIVTILTPNQGKISVIAKGVRRVKSKLAGGIELFSISEIAYMPGQSGLGRLVSARLLHHYGHIAQNVERTMAGYELIKVLHKATEDQTDSDYYVLLDRTLQALNDNTISVALIRIWFNAQLLSLSGHTPNITTSLDGSALVANNRYAFDYDATGFEVQADGGFGAREIKYLRLLFGDNTPVVLAKVQDGDVLLERCAPLILTLRQFYLSV